ncbi:NAD(P)-binding protein [Microbacterium lacticum]|uniref:phytoene desaturase family protein n=1 Tax=Microbacterium lacticum TaxID=33885 RepID=UPI003A853817
MPDATVVGSGPNGLAAALVLARAGLEVEVAEAVPTVGGGARSEPFEGMPELSFDFGSAVHPFVPESEFFRRWEATARVPYLTPHISFAHPLDGGRAAIAYRNLKDTTEGLGTDGDSWHRTFAQLANASTRTADLALNPALAGWRQPAGLARVGTSALRTALGGLGQFHGQEAKALFTGVMAHANASFPSLATASVGLVLTSLAHGQGWPLPRGGAAKLTSAMVQDLRRYGGQIHLGRRITDAREIANSKIVIQQGTIRRPLVS